MKGVCSEESSEESSDGTVSKAMINSAPITRTHAKCSLMHAPFLCSILPRASTDGSSILSLYTYLTSYEKLAESTKFIEPNRVERLLSFHTIDDFGLSQSYTSVLHLVVHKCMYLQSSFGHCLLHVRLFPYPFRLCQHVDLFENPITLLVADIFPCFWQVFHICSVKPGYVPNFL